MMTEERLKFVKDAVSKARGFTRIIYQGRDIEVRGSPVLWDCVTACEELLIENARLTGESKGELE